MSIEDADGEQVAMSPGHGCGLPGAIRTCSSIGIPGETSAPLWKRLAWFASLWGVGVMTVTLISYFIRWWIV
jgi:hypothetical protein